MHFFFSVFPLIKIWGLISHFLHFWLSLSALTLLKQDCFHLSPVKHISDRPFFSVTFALVFPFIIFMGIFKKSLVKTWEFLRWITLLKPFLWMKSQQRNHVKWKPPLIIIIKIYLDFYSKLQLYIKTSFWTGAALIYYFYRSIYKHYIHTTHVNTVGD